MSSRGPCVSSRSSLRNRARPRGPGPMWTNPVDSLGVVKLGVCPLSGGAWGGRGDAGGLVGAWVGLVAVSLSLLFSTSSWSADLRVMSGGAPREVVAALTPEFENQTGH